MQLQLDEILLMVLIALHGWGLSEIVQIKVKLASITSDQDTMKEQIRALFKSIPLFALLCFAACSPEKAAGVAGFPSRIIGGVVNAVTVPVTNIVAQAVVTTETIVSKEPFTELLMTNSVSVTNFVYSTNVSADVRPAIQKPVQVAQAVAPFIPPPFGEIVTAGLGFLAFGLNAARKKRERMLAATIQGIELANGNEGVKASVSNEARDAGVWNDLHAIVKRLTASKS